MFKVVARFLDRLRDWVDFSGAALVSDREDTPLTSYWLWLLSQLEKGIVPTQNDLRRGEAIAEQLSGQIDNPNAYILLLIQSLPVQLQELFFFQVSCKCQTQIKNKFSLVLNDVPGGDFQEAMKASGCSCKNPNITFERLPSVLLIGSQQELCHIKQIVDVGSRKYCLGGVVQLNTKNELELLSLNLHQSSPNQLVEGGEVFKEKAVGRKQYQKLLDSASTVRFMFYVNADALNDMEKRRLLNVSTALMLTSQDDESIELLEKAGRTVKLELVGREGLIEIEKKVLNAEEAGSGGTISKAGTHQKTRDINEMILTARGFSDKSCDVMKKVGVVLIGCLLLFNFIVNIIYLIERK